MSDENQDILLITKKPRISIHPLNNVTHRVKAVVVNCLKVLTHEKHAA